MDANATDDIFSETRDGILYVTFNRPQARNAFTFAMYERLAELCRMAEADDDIRVMLLTGAGGKAFAAGTDISQFRAFKTPEDAISYEERVSRVIGVLEACSKPTIAAIAGACTGGGGGIASACDLRIAAPNARFGFPIARTLGNCLSMSNFARLVALIGPARVTDIIFTARLVEADEAKAIGLVHEVVADEASLMPRAEEVARTVAAHAPLTLRATKEALRRLRPTLTSKDGRDLILMCYMSADFREGMDAFLNKRKPVWTGNDIGCEPAIIPQDPRSMTELPLARFKVIDLTRVRAGPTTVRQLADWGADVVKVEAREGDAGLGGARQGPDFQNIHRNKRSITLDLKKPEGAAILKRLAERADVFVENYRPDVKTRLGIDYEAMRKVNPRLVYASISGFGQDGPYRDRPGFDQIAQGMGGLMSITGLPGQGPVRVGIPVADLTAGIFCAMGILIALLEREVSGEGQWVQSSLLAAQISMLDFQAARWLISKEVPGQAGNNHPTSIPTGVFETSDGHINIAAAGDAIYRRLCRVLGEEALISDPRFATAEARLSNRDRLNAAIEAVTRTAASADWVASLNKAGVPCGPINRIDEVFDDPQVKHIGIATPIEHPALGPIELVGQPVSLSRTPWALRRPTPEAGQHTDEVLRELDYDSNAISRLQEDGVV